MSPGSVFLLSLKGQIHPLLHFAGSLFFLRLVLICSRRSIQGIHSSPSLSSSTNQFMNISPIPLRPPPASPPPRKLELSIRLSPPSSSSSSVFVVSAYYCSREELAQRIARDAMDDQDQVRTVAINHNMMLRWRQSSFDAEMYVFLSVTPSLACMRACAEWEERIDTSFHSSPPLSTHQQASRRSQRRTHSPSPEPSTALFMHAIHVPTFPL